MVSRFQQSVEDGALVEKCDDRATRPIDRAYVVRGGALIALRDGIGTALKWVTRLLYAAPALVVVRVILHSIDARKGELVVAAFVSLVLLFFVMLIFYLLAAFFAWSQRSRARLVRPDDADTSGDPNADSADLGAIVSITGRVVRLSEGEGPLVVDFWRDALRVTEAHVFGVARKEGAPIVVMATTAPFVLAHVTHEKAGNALTKTTVDRSELLPDQDGGAAIVRAGDEVTVTAQLLDRIANASEFELDGEILRFGASEDEGDMPYRAGVAQPALLVSDTKDVPLTIRVHAK